MYTQFFLHPGKLYVVLMQIITQTLSIKAFVWRITGLMYSLQPICSWQYWWYYHNYNVGNHFHCFNMYSRSADTEKQLYCIIDPLLLPASYVAYMNAVLLGQILPRKCSGYISSKSFQLFRCETGTVQTYRIT